MAKVKFTDAEILSVYGNKGFRAREIAQDALGQEKTTYFKVWGNFGLQVGDVVTVTGDLSSRVEESQDQDGNPKLDREGKVVRFAALHVNNAQVTSEAPF